MICFLHRSLTLAILLFSATFAIAQVPRTMSVQGVLTGSQFNSKQYQVITTTLYAVGEESSSLYSQTDTLNIDRDGLFTIQLGKEKGLPTSLAFDKQYVIEFTVNGNVMPMRIPLQSVPYAITSEKVSDNSVELRHLSEELKQKLQFQDDSKSEKGENNLANYVGGLRSVIAGGDENRTSANFSSILGGYTNSVTGSYGTVVGGQSNIVSGNWAFVGGGQNNRAMGSWTSVTAGKDNTISSSASFASIGGGSTNQVGANNGTISGGSSNIVTAQGGTVSGGQSNRAMQTFATVSGGQNNIASGQGSVTVGGMNNKTTSQYSIVSGGSNNEANGNHAIISGGMNNDANAEFSSIAGGSDNIIASNANSSFISGGSNNKINSGMNSGVMGSNNTITSSNNSFVMGTGNTISNASNGIGIGTGNQVSGQNATAIGIGNIANGNNKFVIGSYASTSTNPANTSNVAFTGGQRFSVGIGSSESQRKNAITVFENGNTLFQGKVMTTDTAFLQNASIAQDLKIAGKIDVQQQMTVSDDFILGSDNQAGKIKLIDQSGNWYTGFTTGTQSQDILYRLPVSPPIGGQVLASGSIDPLNLEWTNPGSISETDPQVGTIASSGIPRWNGSALVTGSLSDDGTNVSTSGTFTSSNLTGTNTGDITIGTASGLSLSGQALSLATATITDAGAMSSSDKTKLDGIATGAEVNVNADWNAVSGDAEILNKPTLGTMSAETASDYYTKTQADAGFQVQDADLTTVATIGSNNQLLKVKNDGSGLEWFTPTYISSYTETDPQVGTIATSGVPRWNGSALVTGSLSDDGTNVSTSGTFTSSNLSGTNTGDITIGTASGLSLSGQALSLATATITDAGAMSASDKVKLNSIATGAEVNVNADWNAVSGDAEILNKPTLGTMSAETASDYYTKTQADAGFQVQDADLTTVATIGSNNQLLKVKNDGSGLEWFTPSYISSYTETDPQVGTIATSGIPRWNGTALVTGSLSDDGTNLTTSGTFTSSNLSGTNTGDITIGTASGLSLSGQALSLATATITDAGAMSSSDKTKLDGIATGAEVNVNADWNAVTGDAEILNKPTLGTMSAETASDYYTKTQTDAGFQVQDADLTTVATIGTSDQLLKVKNDGSGLEWFTPTYISSYTETDPQVGTIASSGIPRWNGTALVTGSLTDDGTNLTTSGTITASNLTGTNTGDITIGTASGLSLTGQALSLATATTTTAGAMSASDKVKLNSIATGAEVNVNADWNAVTGDAEILNKPTLGTMSAETASDYYTKSQTDAGFQVQDADLTTVATIGTSDQLLKVKNDGSGLEWFTPTYISSYTETDPQVGTIATSGIPRWNGTALVTGSLTDDGTNVSTSGTFTSSNLSGTNTGDVTIGTANGLKRTGQVISLDTATTTTHGAMSFNDKVKLNALPMQNSSGAFLPTKVTAEERNTLTSLEAGLIVFCTNCGLQGELQYYTGTQWATFTGDPVASLNGFSKTQIGADINAISQGDYVGQSYSIDLSYDGSVLAVGYPSNGAFNNNGMVKIFKWNGTIWSQLGGNIVGEAAYDQFGYSVNLSDDGRTLAVGAPNNDGGGSNAGSVRIYNWNGSTWIKDGNDLDGNSANLNVGTQVILSGNGKTLGILSSTGVYRFYRKSSSTWSQISNDIGLAKSVSFSYDGNTVSVADGGSVEVFFFNGTNWTKKGSGYLDANLETLGILSMSYDGNIVAIGRPFNDQNATNAGLVRVVFWNGFAWIQLGSNLFGEFAEDYFGYSLSISSDGKKLIVGGPYNNGNGPDSGHARVFQWNGEDWVQQSTDIDGEAGNDNCGSSVVISGDGTRVAVGAPENDGGALNAGHVRVFK